VNANHPGASPTRRLFAAYLVLLLLAPVPLGSNRPWAWALLELWVFVLAIVWLFGYVRGKHRINAVFRKSWPALACGAAWLAYVWFQLVPLPLELLKALSPEAARWHALAAGLDAAPLTLDRHGTLQGALKSTAYLAFLALSLLLLDRRERIAAAAFTLVVAGFAQAMFGGLAALAGPPGESAHGTFVNRNHYAAYLVMCLSVGIGVLIANLTGAVSRTWKQLARNIIALILSPRMLLRLALVVMVIALVLTRSRMGNLSFFASLLAAGAIGLALSKRATRSMVVLIASLVVIDVFIVGTYFGVERVVERIEQTRMETEDRDEIARSALALWRDYPVFGSGLGSFHAVIPGYWGDIPGAPYTHAHNDYLQFAGEVGVIGAALLGAMLLATFLAALRAQQVRTDPLMRGISFGSLMGITALMIHSAVDFSLQIPAIALTFMLILAFAWIALHHARGAREVRVSSGPVSEPRAD
jgi:O-antigen ligase